MSILVEPSQTVLCRRCRMEFVPGPVYPPLSIPQETFRSDYHLPSGEEKNGIRPIIKAEGAELARYDVELKRLREVIEKLEKERDALETRIIERRYFISAQRRIPNEIWDEIFEDVCLSDRYSLAVSRDYVEAHALTLAQVCHRFRQLVKGRPLLWSSICVDLVKLNWDATDLITEYLRASGHADLDVSIQCRVEGFYIENSDSRFLGGNARDVFRLLMGSTRRFHTLELGFDDWSLIQPLGRNYPRPDLVNFFPRLRRIGYSTSYHSALDTAASWLWFAVQASPLLNTVDAAEISPSITLPYRQLTSLFIEFLTRDTGLQQLRLCANLVHLTIKSFPIDNRDMPHLAIRLPRLRVLVIEEPWYYPRDCEPLFERLEVPSLKTLEAKEIWPSPSLLPMLKRCAAVLETLIIHDPVHISSELMLSILRECSSLKTVSLSLNIEDNPPVPLNSKLLSFLTTSPSAKVLVPGLQELTLRLHERVLHEEMATAVMELLESRSRRGLLRSGVEDYRTLTRVYIGAQCMSSKRDVCKVNRKCSCNPMFTPPFSDRMLSLGVQGMSYAFEEYDFEEYCWISVENIN